MRVPLPRRTTVAAAVAVASVVAPACGGEDAGDPEAQPVPGAAEFEEGAFDELPRYPGAEGVEDPSVEDDVVSQSFTVRTATPQRVMRYYDRELDDGGWRNVEAPRQLGAERTYRGVWEKGDEQLVVSATTFSGFEEQGETRTTQFSLSLEPAERQAPRPGLASWGA